VDPPWIPDTPHVSLKEHPIYIKKHSALYGVNLSTRPLPRLPLALAARRACRHIVCMSASTSDHSSLPRCRSSSSPALHVWSPFQLDTSKEACRQGRRSLLHASSHICICHLGQRRGDMTPVEFPTGIRYPMMMWTGALLP
jgi:hypothetical protein